MFVIATVLGGGSDAKDDDVPVAQQAGGEVEASQTITVRDRKKGRKGKRNGGVQGPTYDPAVMVEPEGNCEPADIKITPRIEAAVAGDPVTIGLTLQTIQTDACYFRIGADKVTVKITKGGREVWTSRECPDPMPVGVGGRTTGRGDRRTDDVDALPAGSQGRRVPGRGRVAAAGQLHRHRGGARWRACRVRLRDDLARARDVDRPPDPKGDRKGKKRDRDQLEEESAQEEAQGDQAEEQASDRSTDEPRR